MVTQKHREHLERYWQLAKEFFEREAYGLATFFAVTLIEEIGKLPMHPEPPFRSFFARKDWLDHRKKYKSAVGLTLFVNSRVTRIYGSCETRFATWYETGELFKLRNTGLYAEFTDEGVLLPDESIPPQDACLLVCMAGEVYADIQGVLTGTGPGEWTRVLKDVDAFLSRHRKLLQDCLPSPTDS